MTIYFKPTWLYIKQHNITGLKYFGKTVRNPIQYKGSGIRWNNHLSVHGNDVTTIWCQLFTNEDLLIAYALNFSQEHNIVESTEWANLIPENGTGGGMPGALNGMYGKDHTDENKRLISERNKGRIRTEETKRQISETMTGRTSPLKGKVGCFKNRKPRIAGYARKPASEETKRKISEAKLGKPHKRRVN